MKIVLINPSPGIWIKSATIPLGIGYIASYLISKGYNDVRVIDFNIYPDSGIPDAEIYGITATTPLINHALNIAERIKKRNKNAYIILGGPHPTCVPDESLNSENIDFVIKGEGEVSFYALVRAIEKKEGYKNIKGLSFRKDGEIIHNQPEFLKNLDELPFPAFHLFGDLRKYSHPQPLVGWRKPAVNMVTSRGCPFDCHFCYKGTFGRVWRARSPENVIKEWEYLVKELNVKEIGIQDDIFNINIKRAKEIMNLIILKKLAVPFTFPNGLRADAVDEELVVLMKKAGLYRTAIGVESGVQEVMDDIGKNEKLEDIEKTMALLKKHKIQTITFFVMGNPKDTEKTMQSTIDYAKKLDSTFAQFAIATPFPGTRLYENAKKTGTLRVKNWDEYSQFDQKGYFDYPHLKGETIMKYVNKAYRSFYFNIKFVLKMVFLRDFYMKIPEFFEGLFHFVMKGK